MDIDQLAIRVVHQADRLFPNRTDVSMWLKLYGEVAEMIEADDNHVGGEVADVFIMLLDFAKRRGLNISTEIERKMAINDTRRWESNRAGVFNHVEG